MGVRPSLEDFDAVCEKGLDRPRLAAEAGAWKTSAGARKLGMVAAVATAGREAEVPAAAACARRPLLGANMAVVVWC